MKTLAFMIASVAILSLSSCSKTLVLSDGSSSKEIKMIGKLNSTTSSEGNFVNFVSVKGTHYHIDLSKYTYSIKGENTSSTGSISLK